MCNASQHVSTSTRHIGHCLEVSYLCAPICPSARYGIHGRNVRGVLGKPIGEVNLGPRESTCFDLCLYPLPLPFKEGRSDLAPVVDAHDWQASVQPVVRALVVHNRHRAGHEHLPDPEVCPAVAVGRRHEAVPQVLTHQVVDAAALGKSELRAVRMTGNEQTLVSLEAMRPCPLTAAVQLGRSVLAVRLQRALRNQHIGNVTANVALADVGGVNERGHPLRVEPNRHLPHGGESCRRIIHVDCKMACEPCEWRVKGLDV
eukprot:scaffold13626_cov110-Isochrysis_galbana.AAC.6